MFLGLLSYLWAYPLRPGPELVARGHCPLVKNTHPSPTPGAAGKDHSLSVSSPSPPAASQGRQGC